MRRSKNMRLFDHLELLASYGRQRIMPCQPNPNLSQTGASQVPPRFAHCFDRKLRTAALKAAGSRRGPSWWTF